MSQPNHNRYQRPRNPWALGSVIALAGLALGYGCSRSQDHVASPDRGALDTVPATASQYPGTSSPAITTPNIITTSPTPVDIPPAATLAATPTPEKTKPADPLAAQRLKVAQLYTSCRVDNFTNDGVVTTPGGKRVQLNLDMSFERNPESEAARSSGPSTELSWGNPQIILYGINPNGVPTGKRTDKIIENPGGNADPTNTSVPVPTHIPKGSAFAVVVENSATSTVDGGGHNRTTVDVVCGGVQNQGGTQWLPYELDFAGIDLPPRVVHLPH